MASLPFDEKEFSLETRKASPSHLLNKIKCFSKLSKHGISKLESTEFDAGDYKWKVIIYLDGDEVGKLGAHISVSLSIVETSSLPAGWDVTAIFNFFLYNHITNNYLCFRGKARRFHAINPETRFSKLLAKKFLTDPSNGYVIGDKCLFGAEVFVVSNEPLVESVSVFDLKDPYERKWKISDFSKHDQIWSSEEFLRCGYKWKIELHPNGDSSVGGHYVSIFLHCLDSKSFASHKKVKASCLFCIRNPGQYKEIQRSTRGTHWFTCSDQKLCLSDKTNIDKYLTGEGHVRDYCYLKLQISIEAIQEAME